LQLSDPACLRELRALHHDEENEMKQGSSRELLRKVNDTCPRGTGSKLESVTTCSDVDGVPPARCTAACVHGVAWDVQPAAQRFGTHAGVSCFNAREREDVDATDTTPLGTGGCAFERSSHLSNFCATSCALRPCCACCFFRHSCMRNFLLEVWGMWQKLQADPCPQPCFLKQ